jgi:WD40 repeat protein
VWDAASGRELARFAHAGEVYGAAFSPDGTRVATASYDETARIWDVVSGRELARLAHESGVVGAVFSPDGTRVVTASSDKTARVWDVSILNRRLREVAAQICQSPVLFPRDFSGADLLADPVLAHIKSARSAVARVCAELHADVPISISPGNSRGSASSQ